MTFARTECACEGCRACCKRQPGYLVPSDVQTISEHMGESALPFLVASPGAVLGTVAPDGIETFRVGTITPRTVDAGGRCVFLEDDERCAIWEVAPFGCAMFDTHHAWEDRAEHGIRLIMDDAYQKLRSTLPEATTYFPTMG